MSNFKRFDIPAITLPHQQRVSTRKEISRRNKQIRREIKPDKCYLCDKIRPKFCDSHTVPKACLLEISEGQELYTFSALIGGNVFSDTTGAGNAETFKLICSNCDQNFFKLYEDTDALFHKPTQQLLAQIATKCLFNRIVQARFDKRYYELYPQDAPNLAFRHLDLEEYIRMADIAISLASSDEPPASPEFSVIHHEILPYTVPFAFQQLVTLISDFDGAMINNLYNHPDEYQTEPLYIGVFPIKGRSVILVFRNAHTNRYDNFEQQFYVLDSEKQHEAIIKIIFMYSDSAIISSYLPQDIISNDALHKLAKLNSMYGFNGNKMDLLVHVCIEGHNIFAETQAKAQKDYAISFVPDPPALLSKQYSMEMLRTQHKQDITESSSRQV